MVIRTITNCVERKDIMKRNNYMIFFMHQRFMLYELGNRHYSAGNVPTYYIVCKFDDAYILLKNWMDRANHSFSS